ncbi:GNAT family N-acetyltransferase [Pedobacter jamesrossensis]|uniref:GNAT family N-acetyltransferase n=1 Tax=Pedobacter jamesrossensis TaxID=1908238 RepID=A0ABV8NM49_9SPHI
MIRKAKTEDAKPVAKLIIQAMGELAYKFSNKSNQEATIKLFEHFFKEKNNQYSYENTLVYVDENENVIGILNAYDGGKLEELRANFLSYLSIHNGLINFNPEPETEADEFYLDTISVNPLTQGKGIGKKLIDAGIKWASELGHKKVGLLVEIKNQKALQVYISKGFIIQNEKIFIGERYHHMSYTIVL